jgi:hypothetical protein
VTNGKVADFRQATHNANKHTTRGLGTIDKSMRTDGYGDPMLAAADGELISGSARLETVATVFGTDIEPIVVHSDGTRPVIHVRDDIPNAADKRAVRLALAANRSAELDLAWDVEVLAAMDADVLDGLWTAEELSDLGQQWADEQKAAQEDPGAQIDKAEELQAKWNVQPGDFWQLGAHRLICGDCTDAATVAKLGAVDALFCDPPYGIGVDTGWLTALHIQRGKPANASDDLLQGDDGSLDLSFLWQYGRRMVWGFPYIFDPQATGWIVWDKQPGVEDRGITTPIEMASTTMRKGFDMVRCMWGGYYRAAGEDRQPHPTQKPVGVVAPFIESWTKSGETVFDPFLGSGTTLIACERLGRMCRAIEIAPKYVAVALERWATMTGQTPVRVQDD